MPFERRNNRRADELRPIKFTPHVIGNAAGSVEVSFGKTRVICTASFEPKVPPHAFEKGSGWLTAEYAMLPASTGSRSVREVARGKPSGRTHEIQRLIGRALRAVVDLKALANNTVWIDCDVLEADGGTRTASITGSYVALMLGLRKMQKNFNWKTLPVLEPVAAVSAGVVGGEVLLDLEYEEDSRADVDMNLVMTQGGRFIEIQASAEASPFTAESLDKMKAYAQAGMRRLFDLQKMCLEEAGGTGKLGAR